MADRRWSGPPGRHHSIFLMTDAAELGIEDRTPFFTRGCIRYHAVPPFPIPFGDACLSRAQRRQLTGGKLFSAENTKLSPRSARSAHTIVRMVCATSVDFNGVL